MRSVLFILLLAFGQPSFCQSGSKPDNTGAVMPASVQNSAVLANNFYRQLMLEPGNADAWLGYYKWINHTSALNTFEKEQLRNQTLQSAKLRIDNSWQFHLIHFIHSGKRDQSALDAAFRQSTDKSVLFPYAIQFAIITQNKLLLQEYTGALEASSKLSPALYEYHYNTLMSAGANATIYAHGLTDLAPLAVLQEVYGVRTDIHLQYYDDKVTDTSNAYLCLSLGKDVIQQYPQAGYSGLLVQLSGKQGSLHAERLIKDFQFTQLLQLTKLLPEEVAIYRNYLPSLILLYRYCKAIASPRTAEWKSILNKISVLTNDVEKVNSQLGE